MRDTVVAVEARFRKLIMSRSPAERLAMACRMFRTGKSLARAGLLRDHGPLSDDDLRRHIFLRFYSEDFTELEKEKIIKRLQQAAKDAIGK